MDPQAAISRISVLGVPVDILPEEGIEDLRTNVIAIRLCR